MAAVFLEIAALAVAITGAIAGLASFALYEEDLIGADASATLIAVSVLFAVAAIPIGLVARSLASRRGREPTLALSGVFLGLGTLFTWFVVVTVALGR